MAKFEVWYDETYTFKAWFEADSLEHAEELLGLVGEGEIEITELPSFGNKDKNYSLELGNAEEVA